MTKKTTAAYIFFTCLIIYTLTSYGGIREPDGEITYKTAEALANGLTFELKEGLDSWKGFGTAHGRDGKLYSIFGPGEAVLYAIPVKISQLINKTEWYKTPAFHIPQSHYYDDGVRKFMSAVKAENTEPYAARFLVSFCNAVISALNAAVFFFIAARTAASLKSAYALAMLYALATLAWPYSATFFSEPLAMLFVLLSFYFLSGKISAPRIFSAGLFLGIASATHITAMLFFPFFVFLAAYYCRREGDKYGIKQAFYFLFGFGIILLILGYYNYSRFGDFFQTGRSVNPEDVKRFGYGFFTAPWPGLYGLLLSWGKGLLLYCPAVILGIISWRAFHKKYRVLSWVLLFAIGFRLIFMACRSDWPGGFCVGPRYMLMIIPFAIMPAGLLFDKIFQEKNKAAIPVIAAGFLCVLQQLYFCTGEIFSFYRLTRDTYAKNGINLFFNNMIYFRQDTSPLYGLLHWYKGPFILQNTGFNSGIFMALITALIGLTVLCGFIFLYKNKESV